MLLDSLQKQRLLKLLLLQIWNLQVTALETLTARVHTVDEKDMRFLSASYYMGILSGAKNNINDPTTTLHQHKVLTEEEEADQVEEVMAAVVPHKQRLPLAIIR